MPLIKFYKYQGIGNDFILIDNRESFFPKNKTELVLFLCDRHFGIGANGLILLENDFLFDFNMVYYNSKGKKSTMCGNGGRCITTFAKDLGIIDKMASFSAEDGGHIAEISGDMVKLKMNNVTNFVMEEEYSFFQIGSSHHVQLVENLEDFDVYNEGKKIRNGKLYKTKEGANINFVEQVGAKEIFVRTYERDAEDETLACGTGVIASALYFAEKNNIRMGELKIKTLGGSLVVYWFKKKEYYQDIWLEGLAKRVFKGEIKI